jgi:dihydroneopterin aldolase
MQKSSKIQPLHLADANRSIYHVFIRDLVLEALIGVHRHERKKRQPVRINVDIAVLAVQNDPRDRLSNVFDYETIVEGIKEIVSEGHINLVETLADRIANRCLADHRVETVRVRIEKLEVVTEAESVGIEIERKQPSSIAE